MMKKVKCPFCGRRTVRNSRALLSDKFCRNCIPQRIKASGAKEYPKDVKFIEVARGYIAIE